MRKEALWPILWFKSSNAIFFLQLETNPHQNLLKHPNLSNSYVKLCNFIIQIFFHIKFTEKKGFYKFFMTINKEMFDMFHISCIT